MTLREAYVRLVEAALIAVIVGAFVWTGDIFLYQAAEERGQRGAASRAQLAAKSDQVSGRLAQLELDLSHLKPCGTKR